MPSLLWSGGGGHSRLWTGLVRMSGLQVKEICTEALRFDGLGRLQRGWWQSGRAGRTGSAPVPRWQASMLPFEFPKEVPLRLPIGLGDNPGDISVEDLVFRK